MQDVCVGIVVDVTMTTMMTVKKVSTAAGRSPAPNSSVREYVMSPGVRKCAMSTGVDRLRHVVKCS